MGLGGFIWMPIGEVASDSNIWPSRSNTLSPNILLSRHTTGACLLHLCSKAIVQINFYGFMVICRRGHIIEHAIHQFEMQTLTARIDNHFEGVNVHRNESRITEII